MDQFIEKLLMSSIEVTWTTSGIWRKSYFVIARDHFMI